MTPERYLAKADRALASALLLLRDDDKEGACNRAYYAMYDAARAALLIACGDEGGADAKTHRGLIAAFGKHLVLTGRLDASLGRSLNMVESLRLTADYFGEPPSSEDAAWAIGEAEIFVAAVQSLSISP